MKFEGPQTAPVQEKLLQKSEVLSLDNVEIEKEIRGLLGGLAEVQRMSIVGQDNRISMDARLKHEKAGEFGLKGGFKNKGESIEVDSFEVDAGFIKRKIIESKLESALPKLVPQMRAHFQKRSAQPLEKIWIEDGMLKVSFKGAEVPIEVTVPEVATLEEPILHEEAKEIVEQAVAQEPVVEEQEIEVEPEKVSEGSEKIKDEDTEVGVPRGEFTAEEVASAQKILKEFDKKEAQQAASVVEEKDVLPKSAREYIDGRRIGIENDEMLSRTQKDEFLKLTDELEAIETDFSTKRLSSTEASKMRGRKKQLKSILMTGAEAGVTKEQIENAREAGEALGEAPANLPIEEEPVVVAKPEKVMRPKKSRAKSGPLDKVQAIPKSEISLEAGQASVETPSVPETTPSAEAPTPESVKARVVANEILASVPDKEKPALWKKIMGAGFLLQEGKNKLFEKTFGTTYNLLYKKEGEASKEKGSFQLALRSLARGYEKSAKQSKEDRLEFYDRGKKTNLKAWGNLASGGILGLRIIAGPMGALSRLPAVVATSLSRFAETAKEVRFDKKMHEVSEEQAAEEAWAIYESAQKEASARGEEGATFDDLSRAYGAGVLRGGPDAQLEAGTGTLTQIGMRKGFEKMFSPLKEEYDAIQADGTLSVKEKQTQTSALFKKNEGLIKDIDRLVGPLGTIDTAGYYLKRAGVWSKRFAHLVALESLAELGFHKALESMAESDVVSNVPAHEIKFDEEPEIVFDEEMDAVASAEASPEKATETIKEGGSMWRAAKAIQEKLGMDNVAFAEGWGNSTVTLADGREIPLSELDLVHTGDTLSYEDGKFVFENGSGIEHAEHLGGGLEMNEIETIDTPTPNVEEVSVEDVGQGVEAGMEVSQEDFSEPVFPAEQGESEFVSPENLSLEQLMSPENIEREMNRDLRAIFGTLQEDRSEWTQWKTMSARKVLEKMEFPDGTPAQRLQHYLSVLSRGSDFRPIGGFFRREESVEAFIKRALTVVIQRENIQ